MIDYSIQNKKAWEFDAYDFWVKEAGLPADRAKKIVADPRGALKRYANYFDTFTDIRVANICGSCGKKAVPLAVLGADVTVFDISEDNKRYAVDLSDDQTAKNLNARISTHDKYSTNHQPFGDWIVSNYEIKWCSQILELGCGTGDMRAAANSTFLAATAHMSGR